MEGFNTEWILQNLTPGVMLALFVISMLKGWLVTAASSKLTFDTLTERAKVAEERESRALSAAEKMSDAVGAMSDQIATLAKGQDVMQQMLQAWNVERPRA